jgi:ribosomal protein S21
MIINVKVEKQNNENNTSLIRRFTKRVQGSGMLPRAKSLRFRNRPISVAKRKQQTLKKLEKKKEREKLIKLGKLPDRTFPFSRSR